MGTLEQLRWLKGRARQVQEPLPTSAGRGTITGATFMELTQDVGHQGRSRPQVSDIPLEGIQQEAWRKMALGSFNPRAPRCGGPGCLLWL